MVTPTVTTKVNNSNYDVSADQWNALIAATNALIAATKNQPYSYIIYKSGSTYYARNGATGAVDYSEAALADALTEAFTALTADGGVIFLSQLAFPMTSFASIPEGVRVVCDYGAEHWEYINSADSMDYSYTISVGAGVNNGYYIAQDAEGRICFVSTAASTTINSVLAKNPCLMFIEDGDYTITSSLRPRSDNLEINFSKNAVIRPHATDFTAYMWGVKMTILVTGVNNIVLNNPTVDQNGVTGYAIGCYGSTEINNPTIYNQSASSSSFGIVVNHASGKFLIQNGDFTVAQNAVGVHVITSPSCTIKQSSFNGTTGSGTTGVLAGLLTGTAVEVELSVVHCTIKNCNFGVSTTNRRSTGNVVISENTFIDNNHHIYVSSINNIVTDNYVYGGITGVRNDFDFYNSIISGNVICNVSGNAISKPEGFSAYNILVSNNVIYGPGTSGIVLLCNDGYTVQSVNVIGNIINQPGSYGIDVCTRTSFCVIQNNHISNAGTGIYLRAGSANHTVSYNTFNTVTTNVTNSGTDNTIYPT